ncbi:MAG TPA: helix-turn-helix transcriptional regulator [Sphingobium sp.]|uniref:helix-turn-helix transcriptional regulator n=1 Tax=Sphingobium sp. TaxID=1912891 RepID=UPI002ED09B0C
MQDIGLVTLFNPATRPLAGAIVQDRYDLDCPWHHHDMHQIQYAFEGSIELEDAHGRHLLPRNLAGWIPAGVTHRDSMHRVRSVSLLLSPDLIPQGGDRVRIIRVSPLMRAMIAEAIRWPLDRPLDETGRIFFSAFARLCREWIADEAPLTLPSSTDPALKAAMTYTQAHLAQSTLGAACKVAGLSERTLRRRFRATLGMGWDDYRRRARLLCAVEALSDSRRSVAQIAADVGFESQSAFAKAFQQLTGETPRSFRARTSAL